MKATCKYNPKLIIGEAEFIIKKMPISNFIKYRVYSRYIYSNTL